GPGSSTASGPCTTSWRCGTASGWGRATSSAGSSVTSGSSRMAFPGARRPGSVARDGAEDVLPAEDEVPARHGQQEPIEAPGSDGARTDERDVQGPRRAPSGELQRQDER